MQVSTTELFLQDQTIDLDDLTEFSSLEVFTLEDIIPRSYEKDTFTQFDLTVEMNLAQKIIARDGYNILDLFSDIGGIQALLISVAAYILAFWNYNHIDNFLASRLFKIEKENLNKVMSERLQRF